jgi:hypothetical protein
MPAQRDVCDLVDVVHEVFAAVEGGADSSDVLP